MKHFLQATVALLVIGINAATALAGDWELLRVERNGTFVDGLMRVNPRSSVDGMPSSVVNNNRAWTRWRDDQQKSYINGIEDGHGGYENGPRIALNDSLQQPGGTSAIGIQANTAKATLSVTPVFRWKRGTIVVEGVTINDPNDNPPKEMFYVETATIMGSEGVTPFDGGPALWPSTNHEGDRLFTFKNITHPYGGVVETKTVSPDGFGRGHTFTPPSGVTSYVCRLATGGKDEVRGNIRTFGGQIDVRNGYSDREFYYRYNSAALSFGYSATPCRFALNVSANAFESYSQHPRLPHLGAFAAPGILGRDNVAAATTPFWGGAANYSTSLSTALQETIGTPTYQWSSSTSTYHSQQRANGLDPSLWTPEGQTSAIDPKELVATSTSEKNFDHELGKLGDGPVTTQTKVKITGDRSPTSKLTATATIDWYRPPTTRLRSEMYVLVYDNENHTTTKTSLEGLLQGSDEEQQIDEYITEIQGAYRETVSTGAELVGTALEIEMAIGSWYVPDETDVALFVVGGVAKKVFKIARGSAKFMAIVGKVGHAISSRQERIVAALTKKFGHSHFLVEVRQRLVAEARVGHLPKDGIRSAEGHGEIIDDVAVCRFGEEACFVAGTLVSTEQGLRPIETIKKGDLVWSKSESSGQVELKHVTQTFERHAATLVLAFSGGESIETTKEHPFYVEGRGFVPAGELGIGTAIVTRAGPSVELVSTLVNNSVVPVFNLEVENFHTYFVGPNEVWVHNQYHPIGVTRNPEGGTPGLDRWPGNENFRGRYFAQRRADGLSLPPDYYDIHHRIPQEYRNHSEFANFDFDAPGNLQGIEGNRRQPYNRANNHHQDVTDAWANFRRNHPNATRAEIEDFAITVDRNFGSFFWT